MKADRKLILPKDPRELLACCRAWLESVTSLTDAPPGPQTIARLTRAQPWLLKRLQEHRGGQGNYRVGLQALMAGSLIALALRPPSIRVATDINVTTFVDEDNGLLGGGTGISLREAVRYSLSGDTILLPSGTFTLTIPGANENLGATGDLDIVAGKALTLTGVTSNTTIINANGLDRALHITDTATLNLYQVTVTGGNVSSVGGGIRNNGNLILASSVISGNMVYGDSCDGGGLYNGSGTLTVVNSTVSSNKAYSYSFGNSAVSNGGGLFSASGTVTLTNSTVSNNKAHSIGRFAVGNGGGLYNGSGILTVANSTVSGNSVYSAAYSAVSNGGGLFNDSGTVTLADSAVSNNQAHSDGYFSGGIGGGLFNGSGMLTITNSIVSGNDSFAFSDYGFASGGGLFNSSGGVVIADSQVSNNDVYGRWDPGYEGGGGLFNYSGTLTITNSIISGNRVPYHGGALLNYSGIVSIADSEVSNNLADFIGGGLYNGSGTLTVTNSIISGNTAANRGGGLVSGYLGTLTLTNSSISGNTSIVGGGLVNWAGGRLTVTNSTISDNMAYYGGGLWNDSGTLTVTNSTISGNTASYGSGGGLLNDSGTLTVTNSTFSGNTASLNGGGLHNDSGTLLLINSTLTGNIADSDGNNDGDGGGIAGGVGNSSLTLQNTILAGNFDSSPLTGTIHLDASGVITGNAHNLIGNLTGIIGTLGTGTDIVIPGPGLGPLADNGGNTLTHALLTGSPAIDAGDNVICAAPPVNNLDQRGVTRLQGAACDIGAYEADGVPEPEIVVFDGVSEILDGAGNVDFGSTSVGVPITKTFVISNTGTYTLTLTPPITVPMGFSLASGFAATSLLPGEATMFTVRMDAAALGTYGGELLFANSDGDENPFNFLVSGMVELYKLYLPLMRQ